MIAFLRFVLAPLFVLVATSAVHSPLIQAQPLVSEYLGTCDASAAVFMGHEQFVVADDEENSLRVYRLEYPEPVKSYSLDAFAKVDPERPEMDIEAATIIGSRIYWITSHGANKNANFRPGRHRFFATDIHFVDGQLSVMPAGVAYSDLLDDLARAPQLQKYRLDEAAHIAPKDAGGLNIEGLADTTTGALLLGFRNPTPGGKALIVTIENPSDVIHGKKPTIGLVAELSLGGNGIRSMERNGDHYLIVAGSSGEGSNFHLFRWQGPEHTAIPVLVPAVDFEDLHPEALFVSSKGRVYVLSDDGRRKINDVDCKNLPVEKRRFRAKVIKPYAE